MIARGSVPLAALADRASGVLAEASGGRVLIGIAGSPGAGKSTLASALADALRARLGVTDASGPAPAAMAVHLPMDGFHLANATLDRLGLRGRKGAIETFDGWGFLALLDRVRRETDHVVYAPGFDRAIDEAVAGQIAVAAGARVVVVEGNYLLADGEPWRRVRALLDECWFVAASDEERERRLVARHTAGGRSPAEARAWAREVDGANARAIEAARSRADLVVSGTTWTPVT
ncbi:nucleoside/nucleotide kinase family protein [Agromyces sp. GXQ0307]|uniref:nucleoside/nucleotide kinase family protein n=1 Tax=Agromyces sp. GXQ0307 TaxID=3377835 RepID=UPI003839E1C8